MAEVQAIETVEYRDIQGFPGYRVGSDGSVWSRYVPGGRGRLGQQWRPVKPLIVGRGKGHCQVVLAGGHQRYVHRLVLEAFIGPCPEGMEACHFPDASPTNNALSNLRWDSHKANFADAVEHGVVRRGEGQSAAKLTEADVAAMRRQYADRELGQSQLADRHGVTQQAVSEVVRRKTWKHVS